MKQVVAFFSGRTVTALPSDVQYCSFQISSTEKISEKSLSIFVWKDIDPGPKNRKNL